MLKHDRVVVKLSLETGMASSLDKIGPNLVTVPSRASRCSVRLALQCLLILARADIDPIVWAYAKRMRGFHPVNNSVEKVVSPEMARFNSALRGVLQVSKGELNRLLADEKANAQPRKAGRKSNSSVSSRVSGDMG